jgi:hypothetical protein
MLKINISNLGFISLGILLRMSGFHGLTKLRDTVGNSDVLTCQNPEKDKVTYRDVEFI